MSALVTYPGPGCIVEYMEGNAPQIALVTEEQGGKLRLLLPNRRETRLGTNRLLPWSGPTLPALPGRDAAVHELEQHRSRRAALAESINVLELWEMAEGEMERASAQWFAELGGSAPDVDTIAAYGHALLACKSHFKFQPPHFEIFSAATVEARLAEQEAVRRREVLITGGAVFFRLLWDVYNKKRTLPLADSSDWPPAEIQERLARMLCDRISDPETTEDDNLWRMLVKGLPDVQHLPLHLATAWELVPPHYNFWMDRADYSAGNDWTSAHTEAIARLTEAVRRLESGEQEAGEADGLGMPDLPPFLGLPFISIDGASTRDVDDAYFVEALPDGGKRLYLALACPALLWPFDSELDKAVFRRATSIYLPEGTHHMLPEVLGTHSLSLTAGQTRPALCVRCDVDVDGALVDCEPTVCRVRLGANLTYEDCEAVLEGAAPVLSSAAPFAAQLALGEELSLLRQKVRIAAGAVIMDRPDPKLILEGEGANVKVVLEDAANTPRAQTLVSEMMILASAAMAQWGQEREIPLLYRTQDVGIPKEYAGVWTEPHHMARIIRALVPSCLEAAPRPHAGLGVTAYSPVTSPLRRYPDLVNEAQIVHTVLYGAPRWDAAALADMLTPLNMRLDAAGQVQRFRPRYWKLYYVRQHGDKIWWDGVVTEENDNFATVSLPREQLFVRGKRHMFGERACPGQPVQVRLGKVNPLYNEIVLLEVAEV